MSCSTISRVKPRSSRSFLSNGTKAWVSAGFMPAAGSSSSRILGCDARARAISSRRWSPYDRSPARRSASCSKPTKASCSRAFASASRSSFLNDPFRMRIEPMPLLRRLCMPVMTFSTTRMSANMRMFWKVRATPRLVRSQVGNSSSGSSRRRIDPAVAGSTPEIMLKSVVLPAPLGPMRPWTVFSCTWKVTPSTASKPPNCFVSPSTSSVV